MSQQLFFDLFEQQKFAQALEILFDLPKKEQQELFKQLYYQAREAKTPYAVSVLYRKLHDNKTFDDFYNAWMPPQDKMNPVNVGENTYYHFFNTPTRVLNAVNMEDPSEIISIGMVWCDEKDFAAGLEQAKADSSNQVRHDNISEVADKISTKIYQIKADTNLGN